MGGSSRCIPRGRGERCAVTLRNGVLLLTTGGVTYAFGVDKLSHRPVYQVSLTELDIDATFNGIFRYREQRYEEIQDEQSAESHKSQGFLWRHARAVANFFSGSRKLELRAGQPLEKGEPVHLLLQLRDVSSEQSPTTMTAWREALMRTEDLLKWEEQVHANRRKYLPDAPPAPQVLPAREDGAESSSDPLDELRKKLERMERRAQAPAREPAQPALVYEI